MRRTLTAAVATAALTVGLMAPAAARPDFAGPPEADNTIVDVAIAANSQGPLAGQLDTLLSLATDFDLVDTLDGRRQFTLFAPTDDAFARALAANPNLTNDQILEILLYHVAPGERLSDDVLSSRQVNTLSGTKIPIESDATPLDEAGAIALDVDASNGVIHVISEVMIPFNN